MRFVHSLVLLRPFFIPYINNSFYIKTMRYFFWTGCAIIVTSLVIHIRRRNALLHYLQETKLNDHVNRTREDDFIYSM